MFAVDYLVQVFYSKAITFTQTRTSGRRSVLTTYYNMAGLGKIDGPQDPDEDVIIIHLGHLTNEQFERVQQSIIAFMNTRWPNLSNIGIDS